MRKPTQTDFHDFHSMATPPSAASAGLSDALAALADASEGVDMNDRLDKEVSFSVLLCVSPMLCSSHPLHIILSIAVQHKMGVADPRAEYEVR